MACGGLHGHVKVSPVDGSTYVPNASCGGKQGLFFSTNNGATWSLSKIPDSATGTSDPSVAIGAGGTIYWLLRRQRVSQARGRQAHHLADPRDRLGREHGRRHAVRDQELRVRRGAGPTSPGFLTLHADGTPPGTSTISFGAGQTRANNAVSGLSVAGDGTLRVFASMGGQSPSVNVILDVNGYFE